MTIEQLIALRKRTDSWDQVVLSPADFSMLVDAARVVSDLSGGNPIAVASGIRRDRKMCFFCSADRVGDDPVDHADYCLFRRARALTV